MGNMNKDHAQDFVEFARLANRYENMAETALANYIHEVQQKTDNGFIKFDEHSFPRFFNVATNEHEMIWGIWAVGDEQNREFLIYTDDLPYDEMEAKTDGWFRWRDYGELLMDNVYYYVAQVDKTLNTK
jgi:hypothetical protein